MSTANATDFKAIKAAVRTRQFHCEKLGAMML
jgi:hypothetical protein